MFYVIAGRLRVEAPDRPYTVDAGQALVVEPGSLQRAFTPDDADGSAHVVAIGVPSYGAFGRDDARPHDPDGTDGR